MITLLFKGWLLALFFNPLTAEPGDDPVLKTRSVAIERNIKKIILNGDADIIFVKDNSNYVLIEENVAIENTVKLKSENAVLTVDSKEFYRNRRPLVLIPVSDLESLELNGTAEVSTAALLKSKKLRVYVNGNCKIRIAAMGTVSVESSPDYFLNFKKGTATQL